MKTNTIIIKKGEISSRIQVLKELTDSIMIKEWFELKDIDIKSMFHPTRTVSVAKKSYKVTLTVEEVDEDKVEDEEMLNAFVEHYNADVEGHYEAITSWAVQDFLKVYRK